MLHTRESWCNASMSPDIHSAGLEFKLAYSRIASGNFNLRGEISVTSFFLRVNFFDRIICISNCRSFTEFFLWQFAVIAVNFRDLPRISFAILAEVYNRMSRAHAYSTAPILITFNTYIWAFGSLKLVLVYISQIRLAGMVTCIFGFSQLVFSTAIEEMDVSALKAHPLHDKRGYDILKNYFCVYIFTL